MVSFYRPQLVKAQPQEYEVSCEELDLKGQGVCKCAEQICFVQGLLPGEVARVRGVPAQKGGGRFKLVKLLRPSADRMPPDCPYLGKCGGCTLQHVPQELALQSKVAGLRRLYAKQIKRELPEPDIVIRSPALGYRRAARLAVRYDRGKLSLGFRRENSHEICSVEHCLILSERINALLPALRSTLSKLPQLGKIGHVEVLDSDGGVGITLRYVARPLQPDLKLWQEFARATATTVYVSTMQQSSDYVQDPLQEQSLEEHCIAGSEQNIFLECGKLRILCSPGSFVQINRSVNNQLIALVLDWLKPHAGERVLDLFCGLGNFSFPLAQAGAKVVGVDVGQQMIKQAQALAEIQNLEASFYAVNLAEPFEQQRWAKEPYTAAILDPGRRGASRAYAYVLKNRIPTVLMISCNPTVGMRDLSVLLEGGYQLRQWGVLDMFPRTEHVETVVLMSRQNT